MAPSSSGFHGTLYARGLNIGVRNMLRAFYWPYDSSPLNEYHVMAHLMYLFFNNETGIVRRMHSTWIPTWFDPGQISSLDLLALPQHRSHIQCKVGIRCIRRFPIDSYSKQVVQHWSCVNNMLQIVQNMMFSLGLELEQSMFKRTTLSIQHPLF